MNRLPDFQQQPHSNLCKEIAKMAKEDQRKLLSERIAREIEGISGEVEALTNLVRQKEKRGMTWLRRWNKVNNRIAMSIFVFLMLMYPGCAIAGEIKASWYSVDSLTKEGTWKNGKSKPMANGKQFYDNLLVAASRDYPLNTRLRVTNLENGRSVCVKVTDRIGKRFKGKRIDLSKGAFGQIANHEQGVVPVKVEVII